MGNKLRDKAVSEAPAIKGKLYDIEYHLFVMKDKDCIAKLMATDGSLPAQDGAKESVCYVRDESQPTKWRRATF